MKSIARQLKEWRGSLNMIQAAEKIGIPVTTYRHLEGGRKIPHPLLILTRIKYLELQDCRDLPDIVVD